MKISKIDRRILFLALSCGLIIVDQIIKAIVVAVFPSTFSSVTVIPHVLNFTYVQNHGAAFSILGGHTWLLIILAIILLIIFIYLIVAKKAQSFSNMLALSLIIAGGVGNLIDRIFRGGAVVDYIDLTFWPLDGFAIFNLADCMVVIGTVILIVLLLVDLFRPKKNQTDSKEMSK